VTMRPSGPPVNPSAALPVPPPTVPMAPMPSPDTLRALVTGPSSVPEDGRSVSAPLPRPRHAPLSRQQGRLVSDRHAKNPSGNGPK
jgi:hypothetical protein